ncbi:hypothetical protein [Nonomuraea sp. NPDC050643]|uniref:hypothetical protein n=1 Tax=Nonomuraea sp. NPDC050643 TaxID=3155660 RepID=UPI003400D47F
MAMSEAILAGTFALSGVALQQIITMIVTEKNRRNEEARQSRADRRILYGRTIAQARRIQRLLKESTSHTTTDIESRLDAELDLLGEYNAELRLVASPATIQAVLDLEDEMRARADSMERRKSGPIPLAPIIDALRKDLELS